MIEYVKLAQKEESTILARFQLLVKQKEILLEQPKKLMKHWKG